LVVFFGNQQVCSSGFSENYSDLGSDIVLGSDLGFDLGFLNNYHNLSADVVVFAAAATAGVVAVAAVSAVPIGVVLVGFLIYVIQSPTIGLVDLMLRGGG